MQRNNRMKYLKCISSLVFLLSVVSCAKKEEVYLAKVGNKIISSQQYRQRLEEVPPYFKGLANTNEGKQQILDAMIKETLLVMEAKRRGLDKNDEIKSKLKELEENLLLSQMLKEVKKGKISVDDKEILDYYEKNKEEFANPRQIRISHILLPTFEEAEQVLEKIKQGEKFAKLAQKMSVDTGSANQGGDLGFYRKGDIFMLPDFEKAAFSLENKDGISDIVKTQLGFHIIKLTDVKNLEPQDFNQAKEEIRKKIEKDKFDQWVDELRNKFKVEINVSLLNNLFLPTAEKELNEEEEIETEQSK